AKRPDEVARLAAMIRVTDVNQATLNMLNAKTKDELLSNVHMVFGPESIEGLAKMIVQLRHAPMAARSEGVNRTLGGRKLWVDVHAH
ncbi:hypothetical protein, partial [Salmonella enterica]|uniref:hypothetical protein n=1 Tax=Salmonella enterica TaxID=28901 RepID=UPI00329A5467